MRNRFKTTIGFLAAFVLAGTFTSSVFGVASFARQTGLDCLSCHASAPGFPSLNSFGAAFKAGGYVLGDNFIGDDDRLSIPAALNISIVTKIRAKYKTDGTNAATFHTETPDEYAVFIAGRVGKNVGFVTEYADGEPLSFKIPIVFDLGPAKLGVTAWWSDAFSAAWIFETASTGAVRNVRATEDRNTSSAFSAINWGGGGDASGLGFYVWHPIGFFVYTPFVKAYDGSDNAAAAHYVRAAFTPTFGGLEALIGVAYYTGTASDTAYPAGIDFNTLGVDAQIIGNIGIPVSLFLAYANDQENGNSAITAYAEVGVVENIFNVGLGFRNATFSGDNIAAAALGGSLGAAPTFANGAYNAGASYDTTLAFDKQKAYTGNDLLFVLKYNLLTNLKVTVDIAYNLDEGAYNVMPMLFGSW